MKTINATKSERIWDTIIADLELSKRWLKDEIHQDSADASYYKGKIAGLQSALNAVDYQLKH